RLRQLQRGVPDGGCQLRLPPARRPGGATGRAAESLPRRRRRAAHRAVPRREARVTPDRGHGQARQGVAAQRAAAIALLRAAARARKDISALPAGSPYGRLQVDVAGCTLCLACVGACPVAALSDNPERPQLSFTEAACVQCGICVATCPEKVIGLEPRYNFS